VMWGRKKSGIDMVMVNESIERERERGKRPGVPEICGWLFDVARRGVWRSEEVTAERSGQNKGHAGDVSGSLTSTVQHYETTKETTF